MEWPISKRAHAGIAVAAAAISSYIAFEWVERTSLARYEREYPNDGQAGLGAFMDGLVAGIATLIVVLIAVYIVQRVSFSTTHVGEIEPPT